MGALTPKARAEVPVKQADWRTFEKGLDSLVNELVAAGRAPSLVLTVTIGSHPEVGYNEMLAWEVVLRLRSHLGEDVPKPTILVLSDAVVSGASRAFKAGPETNPWAVIIQPRPIADEHRRLIESYIGSTLVPGIRAVWGILTTASASVSSPPDEGTADSSILRQTGQYEFLIVRPWGWMNVVCLNQDGFSIRILNILPGRRLSLQRHYHRTELFVALDRGLVLETINSASDVSSVDVPLGSTAEVVALQFHRLSNSSAIVLTCLEVSLGTYREDDIERAEDDYGRV
jgi:mannose-1-phosphate guanylyltransferase/mannose-6-phosphate isomerase